MTKRLTGLAWCAFLVSVCNTPPAFCQAATGEKPHAATGLVLLAATQFPNLTKAERAVLAYLDVKNLDREGDWAAAGSSYKPDDRSNDPAHANEWGHDRDVRSVLIRWLFLDPDASRMVDPGGVRILGARVVGTLDLKDTHLPFALILRNCAVPERMNLTAVRVPRLDLNGSYTGEIEAKSINVDTDLEMGLGFHAAGEVSLWGAKIGGNLNAAAGHFMRSQVELELLQPLQLRLALLAASAQVAGNVILCCGFESNGQTSIRRAKISGDIYGFGGHFFNPNNTAFDAGGARIDGTVWFTSLPPLVGAPEFNGLVDFDSATLTNPIVFNGARFRGARGELHGFFAFGGDFSGVIWENNILDNDAVLNLRDVATQALYDDEKSWPEAGHLFIDGFVYADFGGSGRAVRESPSDAPTRLRWLALEPKFHSQPYRQLAKVLSQRGDDAGARQVLMAMEDARWNRGGLGSRVIGHLLKATIGYGHRSLLTIGWMMGVVGIGWMMVAVGKRAGVMRPTWPETVPPSQTNSEYEHLHPLLYSFDVFLPFVNFHQEHYWWPSVERSGECRIFGQKIRISGSILRYYLWLQITAGWLLSAIFLAGVTGLIRND